MGKFALSCCLFIAMIGAGWAQTTSGNMAGTVKDSTGAVIPNATVTVTNEQTGAIFTAKSNSTGDVLIPNVPFGIYDITASAPGFAKYSLTGFRIDVGKSSTANLTLSVSSASTVEVSAVAAVPLDTTTTNLTQTFEPTEISILPSAAISGFGVLNVSLLSPGVASSGGIGIGEGPSVGGQRPRNNNFTIEGIDNNDKGVTGPLLYIPSDAVGEFTLITNQFSPEFGHSSGGQFNTNVLSGTNKFHGEAYEYFQNRNLNAENVPAGQHQPNPRFDYNRYGGQIGGPILHDKLFFFTNYERQTTGQSLTHNICTPTAAGISMLQSIPGLNANNLAQYVQYTPVSGSQIDASNDVACFNQKTGPQTIAIFSGTNKSVGPYPDNSLGTVYGSGTRYDIPAGNYLVSAPTFINFGALTTSGDWTISPTDSLRVRYLYNTDTEQDTAAALPAFYQPLPLRYHLVAISEYHTFTPNVTNEMRAGFTRFTQIYSAGDYKYPGLDSFPNIYVYDQNFLDYGPDDNAPQSTVQNMYQFTDNISWLKGKHNFKIGFDGRKFIAPQTFTQRVRGDYEYNYLTEFLHDLAPTGFGERSTGNFIYYGDQTALYGYANDTWRVTPTLTLNYGVRYEFTSVPVGERAQSLNSAASVPGLINFSAPQPQYKNFAPRIGINYAPDGKTSIRVAFGMAHDVLFDNLGLLSFPPQYSSTNDVGFGNNKSPGDPNFLADGGLPAGTGTLATFCQDGTGPGTGVPCVQDIPAQQAATSAYMPNQVVPYAETWSVGIQRVFASNYTAEVRYVGTRGIHLPTQIQINVQAPVTTANQLPTLLDSTGITLATDPDTGVTTGTTTTGPNANTLGNLETIPNILPQYTSNGANFTSKITSYQPYSGSNYNGLQTNLTRRFQNGFSLNASYTWSKTMDDATAEVFSTVLTPRRPQDSQNVAADYSRSALDRTHRLTIAAVYDLPYFKHSNWFKKNLIGNWEVSPIYTYESPEYATALSGVNSNLNGDSAGIDRPIVNPNGKKGTGSGVIPVYSNDPTLTATCPTDDDPTATQCDGNLVGYLAANPDAYYIQAGAGTFPNASRNTLATRPTNNIDLAASKRINITERVAVQFQAQAFNILNHPQYTPGFTNRIDQTSTQTLSTQFQTVSNPAFNNPSILFLPNARSMQLAAKLSF